MKKGGRQSYIAELRCLSPRQGYLNIQFPAGISELKLGKREMCRGNSIGQFISKVHIEIVFMPPGRFEIIAKGTNPTYLNEQEIGKGNRRVLQNRDKVGIVAQNENGKYRNYPIYEFRSFTNSPMISNVPFMTAQHDNSLSSQNTQPVSQDSVGNSLSLTSQDHPSSIYGQTPNVNKKKKKKKRKRSTRSGDLNNDDSLQPPKKRRKRNSVPPNNTPSQNNIGPPSMSSPPLPAPKFLTPMTRSRKKNVSSKRRVITKTKKKKKKKAKKKTIKSPSKKLKSDAFYENLKKNAECIICHGTFLDPVELQPCSHSFCGVCISKWHRKGKNFCPKCRTVSRGIRIDRKSRDLVEAVKLHENYDEELDGIDNDRIDEENTYNYEYFRDSPDGTKEVIVSSVTKDDDGNLPPPPPPLTNNNNNNNNDNDEESEEEEEEEETRDEDEDDDEDEGDPSVPMREACPECRTRGKDGHKCTEGGHESCYGCSRLIPIRDDDVERERPIHCTLCENAFCNKYFSTKCDGGLNQLLLFREHKFNDIPRRAFNTVEMNFFKDWMDNQAKTAQDVFKDIIESMDVDVDEEYIPQQSVVSKINDGQCTAEATSITPETLMCRICAKKLFKDLCFNYRVRLNNDEFPDECTSRVDCFFGRECTTQWNQDRLGRDPVTGAHTRFNHICENTKGSRN